MNNKKNYADRGGAKVHYRLQDVHNSSYHTKAEFIIIVLFLPLKKFIIRQGTLAMFLRNLLVLNLE